jgi:hypothetical protein
MKPARAGFHLTDVVSMALTQVRKEARVASGRLAQN